MVRSMIIIDEYEVVSEYVNDVVTNLDYFVFMFVLPHIQLIHYHYSNYSHSHHHSHNHNHAYNY
jgi:hypothetical protein